MEDLLNLVRREVARVLAGRATTRIGLIDSYDPTSHAAKVLFQPDGTLSGWIPVGTAMAGNGYGIAFAPNLGDQVLVHFLEGDHGSGVIGMRLYSDADLPLPVPAGEMWAIHSTGSGWKFHNDGSGEIITEQGLTATVGGALTANITGAADLTIGGALSANVSGNAEVTAPEVTVNSSNINLGGSGGSPVKTVAGTSTTTKAV